MALAKNVAKASGALGIIVAAIFAVEGGYVNNPKDPGGETNHGITVAVARANGYKGPMKDLTREQAEQIYIKNYIENPGYAPLVDIQPAVAHKVIDAGVNTGPGRSSLWFKQSLNDLSRGGKDYPQINVGGTVGIDAVNSYKALEQKRGKVKACQLILKQMDVRQGMHYINLNMSDFTVGWFDHRIGNVPLTDCKAAIP